MLHCFYGAQQPSLCQLVDLILTTDIIQLNLDVTNNPSDYLAIGYFITSLLSTCSADLPPVRLLIHCSNRTDDHCLTLLLSELSKYTVENQPTASSRKVILLVGILINFPILTETKKSIITMKMMIIILMVAAVMNS